MSASDIAQNLQDIELDDQYERESSVRLRDGLDISKLCSGEATEFEVRTDDFEDSGDFTEKTYFEGEELYDHVSPEALGFVDHKATGSSDSEEDSDLMPFERLARKMTDVTPDKDKGVLKKLITEGIGSEVPAGAFVTVHYDVYTELADKPFDSSWLRGRKQKFQLGKGKVIEGLEIAVSTMKKEEYSQFLVQPDYAYGELGCPPRCPPNATVLFNIKLLHFAEHACIDYYDSLTKEEKNALPIKEIVTVALAQNELGRQLFKEGRYGPAKSKYQKACRILEDTHLADESEERIQQKMLLKIYNNMAMCALNLQLYPFAIDRCKKVLEIDNNNTKALYRMGQALHRLSDFEKARIYLKRAQRQEPNNSDINRALANLEKSIQEFKTLEKKRCQRMFESSNKTTEAEQKAAALKQKLSDGESSSITDEFRKMVERKLINFRDDSTMTELPFPAATFRDDELSHILITAEDMGFTTTYAEKDHVLNIRILKRKEE